MQSSNNKSHRGISTNTLLLYAVVILSFAWVSYQFSRVECQTSQSELVRGSETLKSSTVPEVAVTQESKPSPPTEVELETFIEHFVAANPKYTDDCKAYLRSPANFNADRTSYINWKWFFSQYNQDWFLFVNFFYKMALQNQKGFYVESGANAAWRVSNTAFLDYCLGWKGLCIEPTIQYHDQLRNERSCELVTNCLSDVEGEIISLAGEMSGVAGDRAGAINVTCRRLDNLLRERNIYKVDLWSVDVDGYETKIMGGMDWNDSAKDSILIQTILMEQQDLMSSPCTQINIDYRLTTLGYGKYRIVSDAVYYKVPQLRFADSNVHASGGSRTHALDSYYHGLEDERCKAKGGVASFFTDPL